MGNQIGLCCRQEAGNEANEINRNIYKDNSYKLGTFEEKIDAAKAFNEPKTTERFNMGIQGKSQEIFQNAKFPDMDNYNKEGPEAFLVQTPMELNEKFSNNVNQYNPKISTEKFVSNGNYNSAPKPEEFTFTHEFLFPYLVNQEDVNDVDLEKFLNDKVRATRRKHGDIREDTYLKNLFLKVNVNDKSQGQIIIPPVYIDRIRRDEIYSGSWKEVKSLEMPVENIQNLKSISKFNGFGTLVKADKSVVEGYFREGELDGPGRIIVANGDLFKGIYQNGFLNDNGVFIDFAGNIYEGKFKLNIMDGYGEERFTDNSYFKGDYKSNKKNGKGKFVWTDGSYYEGELQENSLHGKGTYQWSSGLRYEGEWVKGSMTGRGIITTPNGDYYEGEFKENKKDGFGLFWWNEKKYYLGYWKDGQQHGNGKFFKEGKLMIGYWNRGKFEKHLENEMLKFPPGVHFNKKVSF